MARHHNYQVSQLLDLLQTLMFADFTLILDLDLGYYRFVLATYSSSYFSFSYFCSSALPLAPLFLPESPLLSKIAQ